MTKRLPKYPCNDCSVDVLKIGDWYMADDWRKWGLGWNDNLCLACLEKRLGRPLRPGWDDVHPASTPCPKISARLLKLWKPMRSFVERENREVARWLKRKPK